MSFERILCSLCPYYHCKRESLRVHRTFEMLRSVRRGPSSGESNIQEIESESLDPQRKDYHSQQTADHIRNRSIPFCTGDCCGPRSLAPSSFFVAFSLISMFVKSRRQNTSSAKGLARRSQEKPPEWCCERCCYCFSKNTEWKDF